MSDDDVRIEWYDCRGCGADYTWFSIEVMDGVDLYGWIHRDMDEAGRCARDKGLTMKDTRV